MLSSKLWSVVLSGALALVAHDQLALRQLGQRLPCSDSADAIDRAQLALGRQTVARRILARGDFRLEQAHNALVVRLVGHAVKSSEKDGHDIMTNRARRPVAQGAPDA